MGSPQGEIAQVIISLGKRVKEETGGEVRILTVERRPVPHRISPFRYNRQRTLINGFLKHRDAFTRGRLVFSEATDQDSQDGVHLRHTAIVELANLLEWHIQQFAGSNW